MTEILNMNPVAIKEHLRVSAAVYQRICRLIPAKRSGWEVEIDVAVFLFWIATGTSRRVVGAVFNVPRNTTKRICDKMLDYTLNTLMKQIIKYPREEELPNIAYKFCNRAGTPIFDRAVGAIDGSHIRIQCQTSLHDQYINRKLNYSIQCQAVCDSNYKFLDICVGYPGSVHDTRVMYNSSLYHKRLYPPPGYYLLGDSGYPCSLNPIAILTPFKETGGERLSALKKRFNNLHSKARNVVECVFGQMKKRWRSIFNKELELKIENCIKTIVACCVLHNICVDMNDIMEADLDTAEEPAQNARCESDYQPVSDTGEGIAFRQEHVNRLQTILNQRNSR